MGSGIAGNPCLLFRNTGVADAHETMPIAFEKMLLVPESPAYFSAICNEAMRPFQLLDNFLRRPFRCFHLYVNNDLIPTHLGYDDIVRTFAFSMRS